MFRRFPNIPMIRAHRRLIAKLAMALLLFMRLAVAAYACPGMAAAYELSQAMANAAMDMAGDCCPTLDPAAPNLCLQHGQQESQVAGLSSPPAPLLVDLPLLTVVPAIALSFEPALPDIPPEFLARTTAPPPAIRFGVFRS